MGALRSIPDTGGVEEAALWTAARVAGAQEAAAAAGTHQAQAGDQVKPFSREDNPVVGLGPRDVLLSPAFQGFRPVLTQWLNLLLSRDLQFLPVPFNLCLFCSQLVFQALWEILHLVLTGSDRLCREV